MATKPQKRASARRRGANRARASAREGRRVRARRIVAGARYKITKRCLERRFLMAPDRKEVGQLIGFVLALCAARFGVEIHAACFMSNHYHLDVTDPRGEMPAFKCMLNAFLARGFNCLRGRFDKFWSADRACDVELVDDDDIIDRMAYTLANPVTAGLVKRSQRWPGFTTAGNEFGTVMKFRRPKFFFDPNNADVPEEVELRIVRPRLSSELDARRFDERLAQAVREREAKAKTELRKQHRRFLGEVRLRRQRWRARPDSYDERFDKTPKVASRSKWARIAALQRNRKWEAAYGHAFDARMRGEDVAFPYGTYALRRFAGVRVAQAPP